MDILGYRGIATDIQGSGDYEGIYWKRRWVVKCDFFNFLFRFQGLGNGESNRKENGKES